MTCNPLHGEVEPLRRFGVLVPRWYRHPIKWARARRLIREIRKP